jgi:hypothetical protein
LALEIAGRHTRLEALRVGEEASSPFERKYRESGQALWRVNARL